MKGEKKMQISIKMAKTTVIALVLLMASIMLFANVSNVPVVKAAEVATIGPPPAGVTPAVTTKTVCSLSVKPAVLGLGQTFLVNVWLNPAVTAQRAVRTYTFTITQPDGQTVVFDQDSELATAATWFNYVADQIGEWKIKVSFSGCYFNGTSDATTSAYYLPSSAPEQTITCQENVVSAWPGEALPTDYWTRPVDFSHRDWWPILGNYPAVYDGTTDPQWDTRYPGNNPYWSAQYDFTPWVQSPHSSHIVWIEQNLQAGVVGGQMGQGGNTIGRDLSTSARLSNLVYAGRGYRTVVKPALTSDGQIQQTTLWQSYDVRTGEVFWEITPPAQMPTIIEYEVSVTTAAASAGAVTANLIYLSTSRLMKYDPFTGSMTRNITIDPTMRSSTYYKNGYVLSIQDLGSSAPAEERYRLINWTTGGTTTNFASRMVSNTSYARNSLPSVIDWQVGLGATVSGTTTAGVMSGVTVTGFNLYTGAQMWQEVIPDVTLFSGSCTIADHGKVAFNLQRMGDQYGAYMAYDLATGHRAWTSETMPIPWSSTGFGAYGVASGYGMIIHPGYAGITAINWTNGKIVWNYYKYALAPFESPYTDPNGTETYSFNSGVKIADGTVYAYNCEHTTTFPRTRGWSTVAINITTGEEDWSIMMPGNAAFGNNPDIGAIADGYMTMETSLGHFVVFGKGKSATTVTAPDVVMPKGNGVVIKGAVLDVSPAQPGTPCVAKESMTLQMEYLHLQTSLYGLWGNETVVGVPVVLTAIGADGSVFDLGMATTNGYSGVFSFTWTPPDEGSYEIYATFEGTEAYGSSMATTALSVGPAAEQIVFPEVIQPTDYSTLLYGTLAAVIVAIIIGLVAVLLVLRKH
jgi:hypothetical protein